MVSILVVNGMNTVKFLMSHLLDQEVKMHKLYKETVPHTGSSSLAFINLLMRAHHRGIKLGINVLIHYPIANEK